MTSHEAIRAGAEVVARWSAFYANEPHTPNQRAHVLDIQQAAEVFKAVREHDPAVTRDQVAALLRDNVQTLGKGEEWYIADMVIAMYDGTSNTDAVSLEVPADAPTPECGELPWEVDDPSAACLLRAGHEAVGWALHRNGKRYFVSRATIAEAVAMYGGDNG